MHRGVGFKASIIGHITGGLPSEGRGGLPSEGRVWRVGQTPPAPTGDIPGIRSTSGRYASECIRVSHFLLKIN